MDMNQPMHKLEEATDAMNRMGENAKAKLSDVSNRMVERSRVAVSTTDEYVHQYAWSSVAIAALLGVVVGLMLRRV